MRKLISFATVILGMVLACSCEDFKKSETPDLTRVLILYSVGFNDLSSYLDYDIDELLDKSKGSYVPTLADDKAVFVISHTPDAEGGYTTETSPVIFRGYADAESGLVTRDTLLRLTKGSKLTDGETMTQALSFIKENYPSDQYVLVYSSHGTGWLPSGYYGKKRNSTALDAVQTAGISEGAAPYVNPLPGPQVKSIGQEIHYNGSVKYSYEMSLADFSSSSPIHFDLILLDACLMGGVETALELSSITDRLIMSSAEIAADGFNYTDISKNLLKEYNPESVAKKFYDEAMSETGWSQSATVALVNCRNMEMLGAICKKIFDAHRDSLASVDPDKIQRFFRKDGIYQDYYTNFFYDLRDIVVNIGADESELNEFDGILAQCVLYKAATPVLFSEITVNTYCGLSMFLPGDEHEELYDFYKGLRWNDASHLVE